MTNTPIHPKEPEVLKLMGTTYAGEMLPSLLAKHLAPCLNTIQTQPISIGATTPAEGLSFGGAAQPIIPALALKATLTTPAGPLANLQALRDQTLASIYDLYKTSASPAQKAYIDSLVTSQTQVRSINQSLLSTLSSITDNSANSQILAAVTLIQMNVTPVISIHIPFGGDNHRDVGLAGETTQTVSGVATINALMQQLAAAGLSDSVTFMSLNVFGRTIGPSNTDGRQHNQNHQVSVTIGKPFAGGIIGAHRARRRRLRRAGDQLDERRRRGRRRRRAGRLAAVVRAHHARLGRRRQHDHRQGHHVGQGDHRRAGELIAATKPAMAASTRASESACVSPAALRCCAETSSEWSPPSTTNRWLGAVMRGRTAASLSSGQSGSRVPCTKRTGVRSATRTSSRIAPVAPDCSG